MKFNTLSCCDVLISGLACKALKSLPYVFSHLILSQLCFRYMNKEGWAPAVFLKRVGVANGNSPASLKRLPIMGMQLRDKASDTEESKNTAIQDGRCSRKSHDLC